MTFLLLPTVVLLTKNAIVKQQQINTVYTYVLVEFVSLIKINIIHIKTTCIACFVQFSWWCLNCTLSPKDSPPWLKYNIIKRHNAAIINFFVLNLTYGYILAPLTYFVDTSIGLQVKTLSWKPEDEQRVEKMRRKKRKWNTIVVDFLVIKFLPVWILSNFITLVVQFMKPLPGVVQNALKYLTIGDKSYMSCDDSCHYFNYKWLLLTVFVAVV